MTTIEQALKGMNPETYGSLPDVAFYRDAGVIAHYMSPNYTGNTPITSCKVVGPQSDYEAASLGRDIGICLLPQLIFDVDSVHVQQTSTEHDAMVEIERKLFKDKPAVLIISGINRVKKESEKYQRLVDILKNRQRPKIIGIEIGTTGDKASLAVSRPYDKVYNFKGFVDLSYARSRIGELYSPEEISDLLRPHIVDTQVQYAKVQELIDAKSSEKDFSEKAATLVAAA